MGSTAGTEPRPATTPAPVGWRSIAVPSEHGGWSLTAEPGILGLLVAWSWPGLALALAAMVAFVARTPLKVVLVDRWRHRWLERSALAAWIAMAELVLLAALIVFVAVEAEPGFWVPLAVAAPLFALELWYDMRSRGRRLIPELAGSVGIGSISAAIALADGEPKRLAWGLWLVIAARSVVAIPYVRTQILRTRHVPDRLWPTDVAQVLAVLGLGIGWLSDLVPAAAVLMVAAVGVFHSIAIRREPQRAVVIGLQQLFVGAAVILATAGALA